MTKGEQFERDIRTDTVERLLLMLEENLVVYHPLGLGHRSVVIDYGDSARHNSIVQRFKRLRERLHPNEKPLESFDSPPTHSGEPSVPSLGSPQGEKA